MERKNVKISLLKKCWVILKTNKKVKLFYKANNIIDRLLYYKNTIFMSGIFIFNRTKLETISKLSVNFT